MDPRAGVDYLIIRKVQAAGAVSCLLLLAAQFVAGVDGVEGWWIVPAPFLPALAWNIFKHGGSSDSKRLKSE